MGISCEIFRLDRSRFPWTWSSCCRDVGAYFKRNSVKAFGREFISCNGRILFGGPLRIASGNGAGLVENGAGYVQFLDPIPKANVAARMDPIGHAMVWNRRQARHLLNFFIELLSSACFYHDGCQKNQPFILPGRRQFQFQQIRDNLEDYFSCYTSIRSSGIENKSWGSMVGRSRGGDDCSEVRTRVSNPGFTECPPNGLCCRRYDRDRIDWNMLGSSHSALE